MYVLCKLILRIVSMLLFWNDGFKREVWLLILFLVLNIWMFIYRKNISNDMSYNISNQF